MMIAIETSRGVLNIDLTGDHYGRDFWEKIRTRRYEPDTIGFIEDRVTSETTFMDIGAANGAMTLIAAQNGAIVFSYEPDPGMFRVLSKNVELNSSLNGRIILNPVALSSENGQISFAKGSDPRVLSDIVVGSHSLHAMSPNVSVKSIAEEISLIHNPLERQLIIKMDIEGAEWKILSDPSSLAVLQNHRAITLLAVHPGFYRPHKKIFPGISRLSLEIFRLRNFVEALTVFRELRKYSRIYRTNLNELSNPFLIALLIIAGYHEFILEFN
jgi:FkbM family methyltransferase